jgi:TatD DNase family protein
MLTDTHAHLCDPVFDRDREEVLERAKAVGIDAIVTVGENLADARRNLELAQNHSLLRPAAGLYPDVPDLLEAERMLALIRTQRRHLAAIGEVGLDHWVVKDDAAWEIQRDIFRRFIELSKELDLPLNVHSRSAGRHAVKLLLECGAVRVQLHAFDGKASAALPAVEAGYFFSIPPSIVRSRQKQKLVKNLPLSCLLIESDSPVLGPDPQQRNEPANSILAIEAIADLKNVPREAVVEAVMDNTRRLYGPLGP